MLQRAASNAYSWWWASHIRTKQSKWLEQNLLDMEDKVQIVLRILQEEGDSFARRAEMYYKKRPELIIFVEELYRAYRALAERYDHISTELQNANNTIASICPEQVPFMDEDDEDSSPRPAKIKIPEEFKQNIPKVPKPPLKDLKSVITTATKKLNPKKAAPAVSAPKAPKSGLSSKEALEEIDRLQKQILAQQTVKEFVKSSYDNAIARYRETEEQIKEMQEKVCILQDEVGEVVVIEDDEARRLMAEAALKSCQETLARLEEKQERTFDDTRTESKRIKNAKEKLNSLMDELQYDQIKPKEPRAKRDVKEVEGIKDLDEDMERTARQRQELQLLQEKIKEHFEVGSHASLSVTEMAEKIDELVNKAVNLETAVSSQAALVKRLREETDELQSQIQTLEDDKASLISDKSDLKKKLTEMEERLHGVQDLNQIVEDQNSNLQTHFTEARCNLGNLCEKVQNVMLNEGVDVIDVSERERKSSDEAESSFGFEQEDALNVDNVLLNDVKSDKELRATGAIEDNVHSDTEVKVTDVMEDDSKSDNVKVTGSLENDTQSYSEIKVTDSLAFPVDKKSSMVLKEQEMTLTPDSDEKARDAVGTSAENQDTTRSHESIEADRFSESSRSQLENNANQISLDTKDTLRVDTLKQTTPGEDELDWRQLFMNGMQDREKALLAEYTNTLRNFKDMKKKLTEVEKKNQNSLFDTSLQLKELKTSNALKDEEIKLLRQKLDLLQRNLERSEDLAELRASTLSPEQDETKAMLKINEPETTSAIEEKFRMGIDEILEENLDFWLKFSTSVTEIQKFETTIKDLQAEASKLEEKKKASEGSSSSKYNLKSDARPIYKHLVEIQTELTVWLEKSVLLKEELQLRFSSLCEIQEEISKALKASAEDDIFKFTSYQAAKFQGEVLNMKQENHKVADELQAGLDHVTNLQLEVEKALAKLNEQFKLSTSKREQGGQLTRSGSRSGVPLRSLIFGVKPKKQKQSIFSCMTPGMNRKYRALRAQPYL